MLLFMWRPLRGILCFLFSINLHSVLLSKTTPLRASVVPLSTWFALCILIISVINTSVYLVHDLILISSMADIPPRLSSTASAQKIHRSHHFLIGRRGNFQRSFMESLKVIGWACLGQVLHFAVEETEDQFGFTVLVNPKTCIRLNHQFKWY